MLLHLHLLDLFVFNLYKISICKRNLYYFTVPKMSETCDTSLSCLLFKLAEPSTV